MRHDLNLAGAAFRLRPITDADAPLVLSLRSNPEINRLLHPISSKLADQLAWLARYYERSGDYYFVVERLDSAAAEGVISVYDIDFEAGSGTWGRWVLKPGSLAAVESAWLLYRCAFDRLGLSRVFCQTVATNTPVVSFHESCGATRGRLLPGYFTLDGKKVDAIEHRVDRQEWLEINPRLERIARLIARRLQHG